MPPDVAWMEIMANPRSLDLIGVSGGHRRGKRFSEKWLSEYFGDTGEAIVTLKGHSIHTT